VNAANQEIATTYVLFVLPIKLDIGESPTYYRSACCEAPFFAALDREETVFWPILTIQSLD
jgi:hypothetical protein